MSESMWPADMFANILNPNDILRKEIDKVSSPVAKNNIAKLFVDIVSCNWIFFLVMTVFSMILKTKTLHNICEITAVAFSGIATANENNSNGITVKQIRHENIEIFNRSN